MTKRDGPVKRRVDAPPADSRASVGGQVDTGDDGLRDDPAVDFDSQPFETRRAESVDEDNLDADRGREAVPRDQFDQMNNRLRQLELELNWHRAQDELMQRALASGYHDVGEFQRDDAWARSQRFHGIEHMLQAGRSESPAIAEGGRGELSDSLRAELLRDRQDRLRTQQELQRTRGLLQSVQRSTLEHMLATVRPEFDGVEPGHWAQVETLCRDVGHPEGVRRILSTFAPIVNASRKTAAEKAVIDHNARRSTGSTDSPPPEGRGGGKAPSQLPKIDPHQAKSMLLSDLLGFRKNLG